MLCSSHGFGSISFSRARDRCAYIRGAIWEAMSRQQHCSTTGGAHPLTAQIQAGLAVFIRKKCFSTFAVCLKGSQLIQPPFPFTMQGTAILENPQVPPEFLSYIATVKTSQGRQGTSHSWVGRAARPPPPSAASTHDPYCLRKTISTFSFLVDNNRQPLSTDLS